MTDTRYILSYEYQPYSEPTPMQLDKATITSICPTAEITELDDGFTLHFESDKYIPQEQLHCDKCFMAQEGDYYTDYSVENP